MSRADGLRTLIVALLTAAAAIPVIAAPKTAPASRGERKEITRVVHTKEEWMKLLSPEQYQVLREAGTEPAFTGKYWNHHADGVYRCAGCGLPLFSSAQKFDSGTGWPSYWAPIADANVERHVDRTFGMTRTEVLCARCGGHLGHVFDDGPRPTGLRYCINSAALTFVAAKDTKAAAK
jgi:peptide-methionine (R)-S-oxide reductase